MASLSKRLQDGSQTTFFKHLPAQSAHCLGARKHVHEECTFLVEAMRVTDALPCSFAASHAINICPMHSCITQNTDASTLALHTVLQPCGLKISNTFRPPSRACWRQNIYTKPHTYKQEELSVAIPWRDTSNRTSLIKPRSKSRFWTNGAAR